MNFLFDYFAGNSSSMTLTLVIIAMSVVFVFLILLMYIPVLTKKLLPKFGYSRYSDYLPFKKVYSDDSLSVTDGSLIRVYKIDGIQRIRLGSIEPLIMTEEFCERLLKLDSNIIVAIADFSGLSN